MNRNFFLRLNSFLLSETSNCKSADDENVTHDAEQGKDIEGGVALGLDSDVLFGKLSKTNVKHHWLFAWVNHRSHLADDCKS